jgi:hypothetical protein
MAAPSRMPLRHSCWSILVLATCVIFHSLAESTINPQAVSGDVNNKTYSIDIFVSMIYASCHVAIVLLTTPEKDAWNATVYL